MHGGTAVVEGVGDNGCKCVTGGVVVIPGKTRRNFGAGMSGGTAYVFDENANFERHFNPDMVGIERVEATDSHVLRELIDRHFTETGSPRAKTLLNDWANALGNFWEVTADGETIPSPQKSSQSKAPNRQRLLKQNKPL